MMKKKSFWIHLVLSVGLIVFLLTRVDLNEITITIVNSDPIFLLIAYLLALGDRFLMAYKWNLLIRVKNIRISLWDATSIYLKTSFLGMFMPAVVGSDALRAYAVAKAKHNASDVISSIVIDRLLGFLALFVFVIGSIILSVLIVRQTFFAGLWNIFWILTILLVSLLAAIYISLNRAIINSVQVFLQKRNIRIEQYRLGQKLREIYQSYRSYRKNKGELAIFFMLSLLENFLPILMNCALALAFRAEVSLLHLFILVPITLVLVRLPISFSGIGVQEGFFVYFLGLIGVSTSTALLLGAAGDVVSISWILFGGVLYAINGLSVGRLDEVVRP